MIGSSIAYSETRDIPLDALLRLYAAVEWSSANKPKELRDALMNSHSLLTAWDGDRIVGLGNAISDGHLVVYYPHLLVDPEYQGQGIGSELMRRLKAIYEGFHQHVLIADGRAIDFYEKCGFTRAGKTEPMWIYDGRDH
ncbi:MAG: GNAT family N-acetyltransferase [Gemmatimonadota bacterium]|nr:GNAT family N-acetyltransferase [Gemmatimonadota bacterium]